jgi:hypothetical protein
MPALSTNVRKGSLMPEETDETPAGGEGAVAAEGASGKAKSKRAGGEKPKRTHADRAMASLRAAKRGQREVSDPADRAQLLLAEANVLALLDVAEALGGPAVATDD